jgi:hypothetical protein
MNSFLRKTGTQNLPAMFPVILRISFSLILWTLGAAPMHLAAVPPNDHRVIRDLPVDRARIENLQRWVNAGHDTWCRDPQLVAIHALQEIAPQSSAVKDELTSLPAANQRKATKATYTYHSLDGRTIYRITLRRYPWILRSAGTLPQIVWVPKRTEIITRDILD